MSLSNYNRLAIINNVETTLAAVADFETVTQSFRVRSYEDLVKEIPLADCPWVGVLEPAGTTASTKTSGQAGHRAAHNEYITDLHVSLIGLAALDLAAGQTGHGVAVPLIKAAYAALLADRTRGALALETIPLEDGHTGQVLGDRVAWVSTLLIPFYWVEE